MSAQWYAVKCQTRREAFAAQQLQRQGFETLLPLRRAFGDTGRPLAKDCAFFPGYLFVHLDLAAQRWRSVNGTLGVVQLVQFGSQPSPVPDALARAIMSQMDASGIVHVGHSFAAGAAVTIEGGAFHRYDGIFLQTCENGRVSVLLSVMSRAVAVELPAHALAPAG